jgi:hypothetical protein
MNSIESEGFGPCFFTEEEFEKAYKGSEFYVEGDYMKEYVKHTVAMKHISNMAKSYILNNWKKVTDWTGLDLSITHGPSGATTEYYNYVEHKQEDDFKKKHKGSETLASLSAKVDEYNRKRHNPIVELNDVVLDPTDGDFSVTINGKEHWWIEDSAIIKIADYIEKNSI